MSGKTEKSFRNIISGIDSERLRKLSEKVPQWAGVPNITIPGELALEQCSSEATALYKASIAHPDGNIADLTSGLGVDVWAFAKRNPESTVFYNDISAPLCEAAARNFPLLGLHNVRISNLPAAQALESAGRVAMVFIDPARRSPTGKKVFLPEECSPNILEMLPSIWNHTDTLMLKLSPMADISMLERRFTSLSEIHIVGVGAECKEILCILRKGWDGGPSLKVVQLGAGSVDFKPERDGLEGTYSPSVSPGDILFEPLPAMAKSGQYAGICESFGLVRLGKNVNIFKPSGPDTDFERARAFFKTFKVVEVSGYGRQAFRETGMKYPSADVCAKNLPIRSEDLKKKMGINGSSDVHIFALGLEKATIIVTRRIKY